MQKQRCAWANSSSIEMDYHDNEWGSPVHDDRLLFEFLILEGAQAGLSWSTILNKRKGYKQAFDNFSAEKIANYSERKISELMANSNIIRNKLKINAAISNARIVLQIQQEFGSFDCYIWQFVDSKSMQNSWQNMYEVPASTAVSAALSKELKQRGCKFVGPTICYAFMQAIGMVNDHTIDCYRHQEIKQLEIKSS